ncbi:MAG: tetratricopeptide repeat protein, partial [Bacteroidota bacterium]
MKNTLLFILPFLLNLFASAQNKKYSAYVDSMQKINQGEKLILFFEQENKKYPKNEDVLRWLGYLFLQKTDADNCIKYYNEAIKINPKCGMCYANLAKAYTIKVEMPKAMELINKSIEMEPENAILYSFRAELRAETGDGLGAGFDYDKAVQLEPDNFENYLRRGAFDAKKGMLSSALMDFTKASEMVPDNYKVFFEKASVEFSLQKFSEAVEDITYAIQLDSSKPELYTGRAAIYSALNEHELAIKDYDKAISIDNKNYFAFYYRALEKYNLEDMDAACSDLSESIRFSIGRDEKSHQEIKEYSKSFCDSAQSGYYYQRGIAAFNTGNYESAVQFYNAGLKKFPNHSMMLSFRGNSWFALKKYPEAIADYQAANTGKENILNEMEANRKKVFEEQNYLEKFINGFIASNYYLTSASSFYLGKYEVALKSINEAIKIAPEIKEFGKENHYNLRGCIFLMLNKSEEALNDFNECVRLNPNFEFAYANKATAI